eukprot:CAMPEP_0183508014 /NCGR_PEP_ID=MMETSP0371-20130417/8566_1 /TAXON_ID=268820 /ORGANISM="Peridinium aciculiferum, Strain PAER-2" /LENGTH=123 /DNA_ID=CAMNT_0025704311 /DNA_START=2 /DNA_END=373 /DNA_ORIENTATION=+
MTPGYGMAPGGATVPGGAPGRVAAAFVQTGVVSLRGRASAASRQVPAWASSLLTRDQGLAQAATSTDMSRCDCPCAQQGAYAPMGGGGYYAPMPYPGQGQMPNYGQVAPNYYGYYGYYGMPGR